MHGYLSADTICSKMWTVLRERSSRETVSFKEQIMSKDKYTSMFSHKIEAVVLIILQIFCNAHETVFTNSSLFDAKYILCCVFSGTT